MRPLAMSPAPEAAPPWQVLIGAFEPEHIEAELAAGAPLLLVSNNPDLALPQPAWIRPRGQQQQPGGVGESPSGGTVVGETSPPSPAPVLGRARAEGRSAVEGDAAAEEGEGGSGGAGS